MKRACSNPARKVITIKVLCELLKGNYCSVGLNSLLLFHPVMQIIREEVEVNQIPANRIAIGGFSQGCVMGLLTGLTSEYKFAGIVSLSGYMPLHKKIMTMATDSNKKTPIFWGHGDADQIVLYEYGQKSVELLQQNKYDVRFRTYPRMAHGSCPQEIKDILSFLKEVLPQEEATTSTGTV